MWPLHMTWDPQTWRPQGSWTLPMQAPGSKSEHPSEQGRNFIALVIWEVTEHRFYQILPVEAVPSLLRFKERKDRSIHQWEKCH